MYKCCICLEYENKYACVICNFCKEGIICCECNMYYEDGKIYNKCPVCRCLLVSNTVRNIIVYALLYGYGIKHINERWLTHYRDSDLYYLIKDDIVE